MPSRGEWPIINKLSSNVIVQYVEGQIDTTTSSENYSTWPEQFLVPLSLFNPVFTIVIYGW